jgi:hypothetical protein
MRITQKIDGAIDDLTSIIITLTRQKQILQAIRTLDTFQPNGGSNTERVKKVGSRIREEITFVDSIARVLLD